MKTPAVLALTLAAFCTPLAAAAAPRVNCGALLVTGDPQAPNGANWVYSSVDDGVAYRLEGVLFVPAGSAPFPAVLVSHGKGGTPRAYSARIARVMAGWGLLVIAPMYTHAPDAEDADNAPQGGDGASAANVMRAHKTRELLSCLPADLTRVAAHGHSMGAFVTGQVLGSHPADFRAASHTAGGVGTGPNATSPAVAAQIVTPYQLHHGVSDTVVPLVMDTVLDGILADSGTPHRLYWDVYRGLTHEEISADPRMLLRVRRWYQQHGVLP